MHLGLHLPQLDFDGSGLSHARLTSAARAARDAGFGSLGANDHVLFAGPWLDGLVGLAAVVETSGDMELVTSVAVPALRHPLLLAKALVALDLVSEGRVVAGIGPGSSSADYDAVGLDFAERWQRLDEAARLLRHVLRGAPLTGTIRHYPAPPAPLSPAPFRADGVPLWIASWGVLCIGSAQRCAELVARCAEAGCDRMHFWPLGDEERQVELIAGLPAV